MLSFKSKVYTKSNVHVSKKQCKEMDLKLASKIQKVKILFFLPRHRKYMQFTIIDLFTGILHIHV